MAREKGGNDIVRNLVKNFNKEDHKKLAELNAYLINARNKLQDKHNAIREKIGMVGVNTISVKLFNKIIL